MSEVYDLASGLAVIGRRIKRMRKKSSRVIVVGVAGGSGSGKTTKVAKKIQESFPDSVILSMDDYFKGRQFMESIGSDNWDDPEAVDLKLVREHLKLLKRGEAVEKSIYSFKTGEREDGERFEPAGLIILEGLFALHDVLTGEIDLKIFVDVSVHGSLLRRIIRDVRRSGQLECDIFKQYVETVYPMHKLHVEPTKSRADIIILNQYVPEIEAEGCQSRELQVKALLGRNFSPEELERLGFRGQSVVLQEDTYYSAPNWPPRYRDELMRLRKEGGRYFLAYKGPFCKGTFRAKPKIEFEVEPRLKIALEMLGYKKLLSFAKRRQKFTGSGSLELAVDEISGFGKFLEFRAKDKEGEEMILELLRKLGIKKKDTTRKSYLEILSRKTSG